MHEKDRTLAGIGLMLLGIFLFSLNDAGGKWLVQTFSVGQVLLIRSIAALCLMMPFIWNMGVGVILKAERPGLQLLRVVFATFEVAAFYWAVTYLPLADVTIFYLAVPIYVAALAAPFLGERLDLPRIAAIAAGFVGVLVVLRPSAATLTLPALIALVGSALFAFQMIVTRKLKATSDATLILTQTLGALVFGVVSTPFAWTPPSSLDIVFLSLLGVVAMVAHVCVNRSLKIAPASVVVPYQYTLLVWGVVLGYLVFGDVVQLWTLLGAGIIIGSGIVLFMIEQKAAKQAGAHKPDASVALATPTDV